MVGCGTQYIAVVATFNAEFPDDLVRRLEARADAERTSSKNLLIELLSAGLANRSKAEDDEDESETIAGVLEREALDVARSELSGESILDLDIPGLSLPEGFLRAEVTDIDPVVGTEGEWQSVEKYDGADVGNFILQTDVTFTGTATFRRRLQLTFNATVNPDTLTVAAIRFARADC